MALRQQKKLKEIPTTTRTNIHADTAPRRVTEQQKKVRPQPYSLRKHGEKKDSVVNSPAVKVHDVQSVLRRKVFPSRRPRRPVPYSKNAGVPENQKKHEQVAESPSSPVTQTKKEQFVKLRRPRRPIPHRKPLKRKTLIKMQTTTADAVAQQPSRSAQRNTQTRMQTTTADPVAQQPRQWKKRQHHRRSRPYTIQTQSKNGSLPRKDDDVLPKPRKLMLERRIPLSSFLRRSSRSEEGK